MHLIVLFKRIPNFQFLKQQFFDREGLKELNYKRKQTLTSFKEDLQFLCLLFFFPYFFFQAVTHFSAFVLSQMVGSFKFDPTRIWFRASSDVALFQAADYIIALEPAFSAGRFELGERFSNRQEYILELNKILIELRARSLVASPASVVQFMRYISSLTRISKTLELTKFDASLRRQPFGILIEGYPGTGKSGAAIRLAQELCAAKGTPLSTDEIVVLNETDEFQSEYRSNHRVVIFDDVGATKCSLDGKDPWRKVIDFINNITKTSLNPHLELKGNILIRPELVICTTNLTVANKMTKELTAVLNCPGAILRRFKANLITESYNEWVYYNHCQTPANSAEHSPTTTYEVKSRKKEEIVRLITEAYLKHCDEQDAFIETVNDGFAPETSLPKTSVFKRLLEYFSKNKPIAQPLIVAQGSGEEVSALRCYADDFDRMSECDSSELAGAGFDYVSQSFTFKEKRTEKYDIRCGDTHISFLEAFPYLDLLRYAVRLFLAEKEYYQPVIGMTKEGIFRDANELIDKNFMKRKVDGCEPIYFYTCDELRVEIARRENSNTEVIPSDSITAQKIDSEIDVKYKTLLQDCLLQFGYESSLCANGTVSVTINDFEFRIFPYVEYGTSVQDARAFCKAMTATDKQYWVTIGHGQIYTNAVNKQSKTCREFLKSLKDLLPIYKRNLANMTKIRSLR